MTTTPPVSADGQGSSTRPYLIRALHDWCTDNGFTPYLAVFVDADVRVPMEYVKNQEIVLNVGFEATSGLKLGNEFIEFKARFGGVAREIVVPVDHVVAIYARENGQGMAFPMPHAAGAASGGAAETTATAPAPRALRLASSDSDAPSGQSSPVAEPADAPALPGARATDDSPPDEPSPPSRPALKRIK